VSFNDIPEAFGDNWSLGVDANILCVTNTSPHP
jgi:hypothetical protein